ncbi:poly(A)-specific ribonuclease PARN-like isoform X2 [Lycorma delicatula]|uniref:poly(A)-specific ribonuclease PARN-like isoform X2 n=1 Tax=Lycorma delicatula TaxID=130591 RepID=UPI003F51A719
MEVTRANFRDLLPEITDVVNNSSFLCIDGEFTGLNSGEDVTAFDTPEQYYHKLCDGAMSFLFFQFGLAAFQYDAKEDKYSHKAYNFYLFPRPYNRNARDCRFLCQSSCVDFLASQGFDFNKVFREGIPYLSIPDEQDVRFQLEQKRKRIDSPDLIRVPDDLKSVIENACQQVQQFLETDKKEQEIILERTNGFIRRLVCQEIKQRFSPDEVTIEIRNYVLVVRHIQGAEERLKEQENKREKEEADIEDAVGFTHIIRLLSKCNKLIIGHNLLLDLLHIVRQFYMPLPDDYSEFKLMLHNLFPKLLDTKFMCSAPPFKDILTTTVLSNLLKSLKEPPFNIPVVGYEEGKGYKSIDLKYHEAGFDAYMTGLVYLTLGNFLKKTRLFNKSENCSITDSPLLKPYINRLHLMRVQDTHICLAGPDPTPSREHVFYITFPKEWKYNDINQLFTPYGSIFISWINDTSAWVSLQHREQTINVKNTLIGNLKHSNTTIEPYETAMSRFGDEFSSMKQQNSAPSDNKLYSSPATTMARKRQKDNVHNYTNVGNKRAKRESFGKQVEQMTAYGLSSTTKLFIVNTLFGVIVLFFVMMVWASSLSSEGPVYQELS